MQFDVKFPATRMRRRRTTAGLRCLIREHSLAVDNLIYPLFICDTSENQLIDSMPGMYRVSLNNLMKECEELLQLGIYTVALFPCVSEKYKNIDGKYAYDNNGIIPQAIKCIKNYNKNITVIADVALDPYTSHGQDGIIDSNGKILNDETNIVLVKQASCYAHAGADIIAPSDMMDGRIGIIRDYLELNKQHDVAILSYAVKYASNLYAPFRGAVGSAACLQNADKNTYQMDFANSQESLIEAYLDIKEGADFIMVKPAGYYLDIIHQLTQSYKFPVFAYQVSGEYSMLKIAANQGIFDEDKVILESLIAIKRAGATAIISYFAKHVAKLLRNIR